MNQKDTRQTAYLAIDGERAYQDKRWNAETTTSAGNHSFEEWLAYIEDYVNEAKHTLSREANQTTEQRVQHIMRKIAALSVAAMENTGVAFRE